MLQHPKFILKPIGNSIIELKVFENIDIEFADAKQMREMLLKLSEGKKYAILLDGSETFNVSKEARELIAGKEYSLDRIASALYVKSLANKLIGNFFIKVNKPGSPTKIFSTYESAFAWLNEQVDNCKQNV